LFIMFFIGIKHKMAVIWEITFLKQHKNKIIKCKNKQIAHCRNNSKNSTLSKQF
jgi:hypothetical protein